MNELYPHSEPPEHLDLYQRLSDLYAEVCERLEEKGLEPPDLGCPASAGDQSLPLLAPEGLKLPEELVGGLLNRICEELGESTANREELEELGAELERCDLAAGDLIARYLAGEELPGLNLSGDLLHTVVVLTARPFLQWLAERVEGLEERTETWLEGLCPFCGAVPEMGRLTDEEGRRMLWCWLCGTEWRFTRLQCPYCGEKESDGHRYFTVKGTPYRVDLCEGCGRYLKVVDERELKTGELSGLSWEINDLYSRHLDVLAQNEGYKPAG